VGKKKKDDLLYGFPYVHLNSALLRSNSFKKLTPSEVLIYLHMRNSLFRGDNGYKNVDEKRIRYGPKTAFRDCGVSGATYYRAITKLLEVGVIEEVERGGHGKEGVYNVTCRDWLKEKK